MLEALIFATSEEIARAPFVEARIDFEDIMNPRELWVGMSPKHHFVEI
jgi:hypothetical protein